MIFLCDLVAAIFIGGFLLLFWTELRNELVARGRLIEQNKRFK